MKTGTIMGSPALRVFLAAALVAGAMTASLGLQVVQRAALLRDGAEVLLRTAPVDPRDLLRGDYVILDYDISRIPAGLFGQQAGQEGRGPLWVRLAPGEDGYWQAAEASFTVLAPRQGSVVLKSLPLERRGASAYDVSYGIERFYVPEGEGLAIEQARDEALVTVAVRVGASGTAQIRALLIDGKPVYDEPLY